VLRTALARDVANEYLRNLRNREITRLDALDVSKISTRLHVRFFDHVLQIEYRNRAKGTHVADESAQTRIAMVLALANDGTLSRNLRK